MVIWEEPVPLAVRLRLLAESVKLPEGMTLPTSTAKVLAEGRWKASPG